MTKEAIHLLWEKQKNYYLSGETLPIEKRIAFLKLFREKLLEKKEAFYDAFQKDFNKSKFDVASTELSMVVMEIDYFLKHLKGLAKRKKVKTALFNFPSKGYIYQEPYGVVLIIAPWNYPLQLTLEPLVGAIAAGNTVILKPSSYAPCVAQVIKDLLSEFPTGLVSTVLGGREENTALLEERFDYIFFTGGTRVAKVILESAAKNLTPVSLELGGKSPCIIDADADLELAAKRVTWGKYINAGQTCVAPDYVWIHKDCKKQFIALVKKYITEFYYSNQKLDDTFPYIINTHHFKRLEGLINWDKVIFGEVIKERLISPIIMDNVSFTDAIMQEEIFGPIMPILTFNSIEEVKEKLKTMEKPLALYYFSKDLKKADEMMRYTSSGGACINDTIMHLTNENLPFGGVGNSGMGSYHGKKSFETFSHAKSVFVKPKAEINVKYPKANDKKMRLLEKFTKM